MVQKIVADLGYNKESAEKGMQTILSVREYIFYHPDKTEETIASVRQISQEMFDIINQNQVTFKRLWKEEEKDVSLDYDRTRTYPVDGDGAEETIGWLKESLMNLIKILVQERQGWIFVDQRAHLLQA